MAPPAVSTVTVQTRRAPYLTNDQFKRAPTPIAWTTLVPNGTPQECDEQLTELIERASGWVDGICQQVLQSTVDVEQGDVYPGQYGRLIIKPRYQPAMQLLDLWLGASPLQLTEVADLSNCSVEPKKIVVSSPGLPTMSSRGPIQFGGVAWGPRGVPVLARYTYVNGFPVTALALPASAGDRSVTVVDSTGVLPGITALTVRDARRETLALSTVSGNVVNLASPLLYNHLAGAAVTALPSDVEEAVILAVTAFAKARGNMAIVANSTSGKQVSDPLGAGDDLKAAEKILVRGDYLRVGI